MVFVRRLWLWLWLSAPPTTPPLLLPPTMAVPLWPSDDGCANASRNW